MATSFSFDIRSIGLVRDNDSGKLLGTAFSFVRPRWYVTAKHVVVDYGQQREKLSVVIDGQQATRAKVFFVHPELDLAVIELERAVCEYPLFPGHHQLAGTKGLISGGYSPSKKHPNGKPVVNLVHIKSFKEETRERAALNEETIVFEAPESEGGNSGGPIFDSGGSVVGAVIQNFWSGDVLFARGTSIIPLTNHLSFSQEAS